MGNAIFQVNLSGVLKVLSDSLYSNWEVFIRELLQNANDAILARKLKEDFEASIHVDFFETAQSKVLILKDNGIGLTSEEMVEFLSKIGSSSKRDTADLFNREQQSFIGQFGIGLLSCFMVSDTIEVLSTSIANTKTMKWIGKADGTYSMEESSHNDRVGTTVKLEIKSDIALDPDKMVALLHKYGDYLPVNLSYSYNAGKESFFNKEFPWLKKDSLGNDALLLGNKTFNERFTHFFSIQDEDGSTRGIAYILPRATHTATQSKHVLYIKKMFISSDCDEILPAWAFFVKAIVNSDNLATTASRESVYHNDTLERVKASLGKSIIQHLVQLSKNDPDSLKEIILIHGQALKALALEDDAFFEFISDWFIFPTTEGVLSFAEIKALSDKILFVSDIDEYRQIAPVARANNQLVINAGYIYDTPILQKLMIADKFDRLTLIDPEYFGNILNDLDVELYDDLRARIEAMQVVLMEFDVELDVKAFEPKNLPAMFYMSQDDVQKRDFENIQSESDDLWAGVSDAVLDFETGFRSKLFLNYSNEIVQKLLNTDSSKKIDPYVQMIYFNALMMGHYPISNKELARMNENILFLINNNL